MSFRPNRAQLHALAVQIQALFSSDEMGANTADLVPEIVKCVGGLVTSAADLQQLGESIHTILMYLPNCTEETPEGPIEHYDLAPLVVRAQRARKLADLMAQFVPCATNPVDQQLLSYYQGPSQPFGIQGEYYRAVLPVKSIEHAKQVLARMGMTSTAEDIGCAFIEDIAGVSVWGNIEEQCDGNWRLVLEVHDPQSPYMATYTAFARACIVNKVLVKYAQAKL